MKEKKILYNHFHNGDIFYSRVLIELLKEHFSIEYYHNLPTPLFSDMPEIKEISGIPQNFPQQNQNFNSNIINTWIGQKNFVYLNKKNSGCSWENYMSMYHDILEVLNLPINLEQDILPKIYFQNLNDYEKLKEQLDIFKKQYQKLIFISNGPVKSGQVREFDFETIIENISNKHSDYLFLVSKNYRSNNKNVLNLSSLTQKRPDLLELGYISTECDIIIGKASGPYCFAQNDYNLFNPAKTFICFSNTFSEGKYYNSMKSNFFWSNDTSPNNVYNIITKNI